MPARTAHLSHRVKAKVEKRPDSLPESPDAAFITRVNLKLEGSAHDDHWVFTKFFDCYDPCARDHPDCVAVLHLGQFLRA